MDEMLAAKRDAHLEEMEEADDWLNGNNRPQTIPAWHESVGEFLSDVRYEHI